MRVPAAHVASLLLASARSTEPRTGGPRASPAPVTAASAVAARPMTPAPSSEAAYASPAPLPSASVMICTQLACTGLLGLAYAPEIAGSYSLALALDRSPATRFSCPASFGAVKTDGGSYVYLCDARMFLLELTGAAAAFAKKSTFAADVVITGASGATIFPRTHIDHWVTDENQPNGPRCGPTCVSYTASIGGGAR